MVEIVSKDKIFSSDGAFGRKGEGDAVLIFVIIVWREGEVRRGCGGGFGKATIVLYSFLVSCCREAECGGGAYLNADVEFHSNILCLDMDFLRGVNGYDLVFCDIV